MNGPIRTIAMVCGVLLVLASAVMIVAGMRGGPPRTVVAVVQATSTPTASANPTNAPTASPSPRSTASPVPRASYTPLRPVEVRIFRPTPTPVPTAHPSPSPAPSPTNHPSASPRPPSATPAPRVTATPGAGPLVGGPDDDACLRTLTYLKTAADDRISRREAYNAAVAGLAMNTHCREPRRSVNEAYLLAMRAPAEFALHLGDWNADLNRSDALLDACAGAPEFRTTTVGADCATQRKFNDLVRRRIQQVSGRRASSNSR